MNSVSNLEIIQKTKLIHSVQKSIQQKMDKIKLKSRDGWFFSVTPGLVRKSTYISEKLEKLRHLILTHEVIPIPYRGRTVEKVLEWCDYHKDDPVMEITKRYRYLCRTGLPPWDVDFFKVDFVTVFEIYDVAHHLNMEQLIHHGQKAFSDIKAGKTREEIKQIHAIIVEALRRNVPAA